MDLFCCSLGVAVEKAVSGEFCFFPNEEKISVSKGNPK